MEKIDYKKRLSSVYRASSAPEVVDVPPLQYLMIDGEGYTLLGFHHEIYLSDMHRTVPEKLRTIIRQPVQ